MKNSNIEWTTHTWNPATGCTQVSPGCDNCYAKAIAEPKRGSPAFPNGFDVTLRPHKLKDPLKWKDPARIFVNSMSDLFHRDIPNDFLTHVWETMLAADHHIYQVLTKRPHRAAHLIEELELPLPPHIWIGTSVEDQRFADNRIPALLGIPAPVRWLSCEPLLGPLDLARYLADGIGWVIDGGESGGGRRPADPDWFRAIRDDCVSAQVPYLHKQGNNYRPGRDRELDGLTWDQYPALDHPALAEIQSPPTLADLEHPTLPGRSGAGGLGF